MDEVIEINQTPDNKWLYVIGIILCGIALFKSYM
jgi:hypothetical protein